MRATYEELAVWIGDENEPFPIRVTDRIVEDLEIDGEELCDIGIAITRRCGRTLEDGDKNPFIPDMKTVEDLIRAVMWQKREEGVEHGSVANHHSPSAQVAASC